MGQTVLIVDDQENNRKLMASVIKQYTDHSIIIASSAADVLEMLEDIESYTCPDIFLLDVLMPEMNGFELAARLKEHPVTRDIPIIFVTALTDTENIVNAFNHGGVDYISKPFKKEELLARLKTHLELRESRKLLEEKNLLLESKKELLTSMVEEKTRHVEKITYAMVSMLENANQLNDSDTGEHIKRVSGYSEILAKACGCDGEFIRKIKLFASLHDIGKVGISDAILKKPGKYTAEEFEQMKQHVRYAAEMLEQEGVDIMARNIALYHHEKWNGSGYLAGLAGEDIPLEARIVAVADVYDALTSVRAYKKAFQDEEADRIIREEAGAHFDPIIVEAFFAVKDQILAVRDR